MASAKRKKTPKIIRVKWVAEPEKKPTFYTGQVGKEGFPRFRITVIRSKSGRATGYFVRDRLSPRKQYGEHDNGMYCTKISEAKKIAEDRMEEESSFVHPNTALLMQVSKMTGGDIDAFEAFIKHLDKAFEERDEKIERLEDKVQSIESRLRSLSNSSMHY